MTFPDGTNVTIRYGFTESHPVAIDRLQVVGEFVPQFRNEDIFEVVPRRPTVHHCVDSTVIVVVPLFQGRSPCKDQSIIHVGDAAKCFRLAVELIVGRYLVV